MADPENLSNARVVPVIFGFPSFVSNNLSWNPSLWFDEMILFLRDLFFLLSLFLSLFFLYSFFFFFLRVFKGEFNLSADLFFCVFRDHRTALVSRVLCVMFSNGCLFLAFLRPNFLFPWSLFMRLSKGTVAFLHGLLLALNRDWYFHLLWANLAGISNPAKSGHARVVILCLSPLKNIYSRSHEV